MLTPGWPLARNIRGHWEDRRRKFGKKSGLILALALKKYCRVARRRGMRRSYYSWSGADTAKRPITPFPIVHCLGTMAERLAIFAWSRRRRIGSLANAG